MVAVHVDKIILPGRPEKRMKEMKDVIAEKLMVNDLCELHHLLGVKVIQNKDRNNIWVGLETYERDLIKKFMIEEPKPAPTPIQMVSNLVKAVHQEDMFDQEIDQSAVSSLLSRSTRTRPDISYAVSSDALFILN